MTERLPIRPIRMEDTLWNDFGHLVGPTARSETIRQFIAAALDRPGSTIPACLNHHVFREIQAATNDRDAIRTTPNRGDRS